MSVSVIIPTLNEAQHIGASVARLRRQGATEIIVVDGGSQDDTLSHARRADGLLTSPPGRAAQMNAGAQEARGETLLFLHADCQLDDTSLPAIPRHLARSGVVAGCFSMRVDDPRWKFRGIDACATARVKLFGVPYGDQGLFIARQRFWALGGFPPVRFLEDVLFGQKLRRAGRVIVAPQRIVVSPRRWQQRGVVRQSLCNWTLTVLALLGVSPDRLAKHYPAVR